ncbi:DDE-type integrase/transposase/recombinase [Sporofaciens musculi]|nr:DDE-type integrase/transposase/recombinase [Sporofaciens musculi]
MASVMDLCSRKIIGYAYGTSMTAELAVKAVENACLNVRDTEGIILHSDLGSQYTSQAFEDCLGSKGILSFSRKGNPYDNACMAEKGRNLSSYLPGFKGSGNGSFLLDNRNLHHSSRALTPGWRKSARPPFLSWKVLKKPKRIKAIDTMLSYIDKYEANKPVHKEYAAIGWKKKKSSLRRATGRNWTLTMPPSGI